MIHLLNGLVAATHTPFNKDGALNLDAIDKIASHLLANKVDIAFIGGSTGESHSLNVEERKNLTRRWFDVVKSSKLKVVVHVGSNCLEDSRTLAKQAQELGALAISALTPSYFKPKNVEALVECCSFIASAAPNLPFYYYDIPTMTGVQLSMPEFLERAGKSIPNLKGLKFTNVDFMSFQLCSQMEGGRFEILWGVDEMLLPALSVGAHGAVGSTYNFAAPIYHRIIEAFKKFDFETARKEQLRSIKLVNILVKRGYMASAKAMMGMLGVDVGSPRLPNGSLKQDELASLRSELEKESYL
ncbi:MAG: N-acetylneuraminate lyase [Planctomycetes bacterium]|nr:N-acetylneuraminate lyase [Planctomycetota bacterium]